MEWNRPRWGTWCLTRHPWRWWTSDVEVVSMPSCRVSCLEARYGSDESMIFGAFVSGQVELKRLAMPNSTISREIVRVLCSSLRT